MRKITLTRQIKGELLFLAALLSLSILLMVFHKGSFTGDTVTISIGRSLYQEVPVDQDQIIDVMNDDGTHLLTVRIQNGSVEVIESTCKDHICMDSGPIKHVGQTLVCLPNQVVITLDSTNQKGPDGILR